MDKLPPLIVFILCLALGCRAEVETVKFPLWLSHENMGDIRTSATIYAPFLRLDKGLPGISEADTGGLLPPSELRAFFEALKKPDAQELKRFAANDDAAQSLMRLAPKYAALNFGEDGVNILGVFRIGKYLKVFFNLPESRRGGIVPLSGFAFSVENGALKYWDKIDDSLERLVSLSFTSHFRENGLKLAEAEGEKLPETLSKFGIPLIKFSGIPAFFPSSEFFRSLTKDGEAVAARDIIVEAAKGADKEKIPALFTRNSAALLRRGLDENIFPGRHSSKSEVTGTVDISPLCLLVVKTSPASGKTVYEQEWIYREEDGRLLGTRLFFKDSFSNLYDEYARESPENADLKLKGKYLPGMEEYAAPGSQAPDRK